MTPTPQLDEIIPQLFQLLVTEKQSLLAGEYANLSSTSVNKLNYISALEAHLARVGKDISTDKYIEAIEKLKKHAAENERLIASALSGTATAQRRLSRLKDRANSVGTYTNDGGKLKNNHTAVTRNKFA